MLPMRQCSLPRRQWRHRTTALTAVMVACSGVGMKAVEADEACTGPVLVDETMVPLSDTDPAVDVNIITVPAILPVPKLTWPGDEPFTEEAQRRGTPVVFTGTQYAARAPVSNWTLDRLVHSIPNGVLENIKRYPALPGAPLFATGMPMATVPEIMASYQPHFSRHNVSIAAFLRHLNATPPSLPTSSEPDVPIDDSTPPGWLDHHPILSYAGRLKEWGRALEADLPLPGIAPDPPGDDPIEVKPYVWLAQEGVRTPLHYDYYANYYLQVQGQKRFLLLPPSHHVNLLLRPSVHPAHRSSQVENVSASLTVDPTSKAEAAYVVDLNPGEILHIPGQWFHEVTTLSHVALATNVWAEDVPWFQGLQALNVNLPFTADFMAMQPEGEADFWSQDEDVLAAKIQIIRAYIILVLQETALVPGSNTTHPPDESAVGEWLQHTLLEPRYRLPTFDPRVALSREPNRRFCQNLEVIANLGQLEGGMAIHFVLSAVKEVQSIFSEVKDQLGRARFEMLVHNWIEAVLTDAFGPQWTYQAIYDLCHC
eukprot:m.187074 g.187074  ORF g.187074 m.187074 type:complete len:539 (+) comp16971_c0_seq1:287-1903(+)